MATYNMPVLSSGANPNDVLGLNAAALEGGAGGSGPGLGIDRFDPDINFGDSVL